MSHLIGPIESAPIHAPGGELPVREQHGFQRTVCGCEFCRAPCRHIPGSLDVADLDRLCLPGQDLYAWAEVHLRAITDKPYPTLVPARQSNGHCHWFFDNKCAVHDVAPYGCSFFDTHMSDEEGKRRSDATIAARLDDARRNGQYFRVWQHLQRKGLVCRSGDRIGLADDVNRLCRSIRRSRRRQGEPAAERDHP